MAALPKSHRFRRRVGRVAPALAFLAVFALVSGVALGEAIKPPPLGPDGLYHQPWFRQSDLNLQTDLAAASAKGKILALFFEQKGCSYCRRMHLENFTDPEVVDYVRANFEAVQLDYRGKREIVHVSGETMAEHALATRYHVNGTPNVVFLGADGKAVYRMPGYAEPALFLTVFKYVKEKGYEKGSIRDWIMSRP